MKFLPTELPGVLIVEPDIFADGRGYFYESYQLEKYQKGGVPLPFVQDNRSRSVKGTLRGLHTQLRHTQGKLVSVIQGAIFDVVVDIRPGSPTYKKWISAELSSDNYRQIYIPPGYAHGFYVTSDEAIVEYKCTDLYDPDSAIDIIWNDPDLAIAWPGQSPLLSKKDAIGKRLNDLESRLPSYPSSSI